MKKILLLFLFLIPVCFGDIEVSEEVRWYNSARDFFFIINASESMTESVAYIFPPADAVSGGLALLSDGSGVMSWGVPTTSSGHKTVGDGTHTDAATASVVRGDIIIGNATPKWDRLAIGAANTFLKSDGTDIAWSLMLVSSPVTLTGATIGWNSTLIDATTWSDGSNATNTWTFGVSGTDTTMVFGDGLITFGQVTAGVTPTANNHLVIKEYVDTAVMGIEFDMFLDDLDSTINDPVTANDYYSLQTTRTGDATTTRDAYAALGQGDDQEVVSYISGATLPFAQLQVGVIDFHVHARKNGSGQKIATIFGKLYHRASDTTETLIATTEESAALGTVVTDYHLHGNIASVVDFSATDRLVLKVRANVEAAGGANAQIEITQEGTEDSFVSALVVTDTLNAIFIRQDEFTQNSGVLVGTGAGTFQEETGNTLRTSLGLAIGTDVQAWDADLDTLATMQAGASAALQLLTATELAFLDGATAGTTEASKALIVDASKNLTGLGTLGAGAITGTSLTILTTGEINFRDTDISIGSTLFDGILDMSADISIDMFYDNVDVGDGVDGQSLNINRRAGEGDDYISLYVDKDRKGLIGFSGDDDLLQLSANALTVNGTIKGTSFIIGAANISEAELEILDGATVTTTELNYLDGTILGTAVASKVLAVDSNLDLDMQFGDRTKPGDIDGGVDPAAITDIDATPDAHWQFEDNNGDGVLTAAEGGDTLTLTAGTTDYCDRGLKPNPSLPTLYVASKGWVGDGATYHTADGTGGYEAITGTAARSHSFWVKTTTTSQIRPVSWGPAGGLLWATTFNSLATDQVVLFTGNGNQKTLSGSETVSVTDGQWHHIAITAPASGTMADILIYIDATLQTLDPSSPSTNTYNTTAGTDLTIGSDSAGSNKFVGCLDEVAVFDKVLDQTEITRIYNEQKPIHIGGTTIQDWTNASTPFSTDKTGHFGGDLDSDGDVSGATLTAGDGASGTFISGDPTPFTITVVDGIITAIVAGH